MRCDELIKSLTELEDGMSLAQQAHLKSCRDCSGMVSDLEKIRLLACDLQATDEPSPRVWNSLEIALRREGIIRDQSAPKPFLTSFGARWGWARWLAPVAAAILVAIGTIEYRQSQASKQATDSFNPSAGSVIADLNDSEFLQEVSDRGPVVQAQYADGLRSVNDAIREARAALDSDPSDQDARMALMEAVQQKQMLFDMAEDRPLP